MTDTRRDNHGERNPVLLAAGRMADVAGRVVGESLNFGSSAGCSVEQLGPLLKDLKAAVREYNDTVISREVNGGC